VTVAERFKAWWEPTRKEVECVTERVAGADETEVECVTECVVGADGTEVECVTECVAGADETEVGCVAGADGKRG
jgi:hypothetical protein